ncbi:MAG: hypothetical protein K2P51_08755 [Rhabdochlamydiaceae bacterium]|nr:hypothetical protein [Rhabdochlamydiaceae bacterium]
MKKLLLPALIVSVLILSLSLLDRYFLKLNDGFCIRTILNILPPDQERESSLPPSTDLSSVFNQEFHYLARGHQSYAFVSADDKYVIKFYRFPSHLRPFPWLNHPLSSHFSTRRQQIMEYNLEKLDLTFNSYKLAYEELPQETGLLWIHLTSSGNWNQTITLIDRTCNRYTLPLDPLCFVVQKKAELIFPSLEEALSQNDEEGAKRIIDGICELITIRSQKGIKDTDAILEKNYGWDGKRALSIDVGRFISAQTEETLCHELKTITHPLESWLQTREPELLKYYKEKVENTR